VVATASERSRKATAVRIAGTFWTGFTSTLPLEARKSTRHDVWRARERPPDFALERGDPVQVELKHRRSYRSISSNTKTQSIELLNAGSISHDR
jgi:hypothetical protein